MGRLYENVGATARATTDISLIATKKMECFVMLGAICLKAKMPHEQTLWAVAINGKLWFEALRWQGFCA